MKIKNKKIKSIKTDIEAELKLDYKITENFPAKDLILKLQVNMNNVKPFIAINIDKTIRGIFERQKLHIGRTIRFQEEYYIFFNDKPYW